MKKFIIVLKKELIDCFRDKRSIFMMFLPIIIFPILLTFYNQQLKSVDQSTSRNITLATNDEKSIKDISSFLSSTGVYIQIIKSDNPISDLKSGKIGLILNNNNNGYSIFYNQNSIKSAKSADIIKSTIESIKNEKIFKTLSMYENNTSAFSKYDYTLEDISKTTNEISSLISVLGPMLIVMFISSGSEGIAIDIFCGEKERGTLESVLSTQIDRKSLYFAKNLTVFLFVCLNALISLIGYLISFIINDSLSFEKAQNLFTGNQIIMLFLVTITFAFFISTVMSLISLSSKSVKEGNLRISLFTLIPSVIGGTAMYMEIGDTTTTSTFIPIINTITALKSIFINLIDLKQLIITIFSTFLYGTLLLFLGYRLMNNEKVLISN